MLYRDYKGEKNISQLGFGAMRLPVFDNDASKIDEASTEKMFMYAYEHGVNYYDTAYVYHNEMSEGVVGKILKGNHIRDKVNIATKLPLFSLDDFDPYKLLDIQLKRLDTDHIDFYLLHNMNEKKWGKIKEMDILKFIDYAKASGKIGHIGFSSHASFEGYREIIDDYNWDFSQIQLNIMDTEHQAGLKGLEYAASKGVPVIIMEPLKGGQILSVNDDEIERMKTTHGLSGISIVRIALNFLFDRKEILCVLSGMGRMEQVIENIAVASEMTVGKQPENEKAFIEDFKAYIKTKNMIDCTSCRYCARGCPVHILIPGVFEIYNDAIMYESKAFNKVQLERFYANAKDCIACGQCEKVCPQQLEIPKLLKQAVSYLSE